MAKLYNFQKGRRGEEIAASYLRSKGFKILEQNFHTRFGEIDLIATKKSKTHFIEVKLKVGDTFGTPEEMIDKRKIIQVLKTAQIYMMKNGNNYTSQIDAICIVKSPDGELKRLDYYENLTQLM